LRRDRVPGLRLRMGILGRSGRRLALRRRHGGGRFGRLGLGRVFKIAENFSMDGRMCSMG
jgi:hypothetical protein